MAAAQLARGPLDSSAQRLQPQHRRDLLRRLHHLPPRQLFPRMRLHRSFHPTLLVSERVQFLLSPGLQFHLSPDTVDQEASCSTSSCRAGNLEGDFVEIPFIAQERQPTVDLIGEVLAELARLLPHGLVAHDDAACG